MNRQVECLAANETHRVKWTLPFGQAETMNRNNPRMIESAGDFRFEHEPLASPGQLGQVAVHELQGDAAMQTHIRRFKDHAEAACT